MSKKYTKHYGDRLVDCVRAFDWASVEKLVRKMLSVRKAAGQVFLCGNGGSAANAMHIANDLSYLGSKVSGRGIRAVALPANQSVLTCLANDTGYENIFAFQLRNLGRKGDVLIALSGSGNSPNVLKAVAAAADMGIWTCAILGFDGGRCLEMADVALHFPVNDMQIAEDLQLVTGHMVMQRLMEEGVG